jgi:hypothetical protein
MYIIIELVRTSLTMTDGNIITNVNDFELGTSTSNPGTLIHTSGNIIGKFQRWHNTTSTNYLFPVGTVLNSNHLTLNFQNLTNGSLIAEFISNNPGGDFPINDIHDNLVISEQYSDGYWVITADDGLATSDFNISLNADGFADFNSSARIIRRTGAAGAWTTDGTPVAPVITVISRNNLTSGISTLETHFGIGKIIVRIIDQPDDVLDACIGSDVQFSVTAEGAGPLSYQWYKVGSPDIQLVESAKYENVTSAALTIKDLVTGDAGEYYCIVNDANTSVQSNNAALGIDSEDPVVDFCPINQIVNANTDVCTYTHSGVAWDATGTDNCSVASIVYVLTGETTGTGTSLNGVVFNQGVTTVTWTITDGSGNTDVCSFTVTVEDNQNPVITCPVGDQIVNTDTDVCTYTHSGTAWNATATDNCSVASIEYVLSGVTTGSGTSLDGVTFNLGVTTVTWTATDGSGNTDVCSFTVTVEDNQNPVITCPVGDQIVNTDTDVCTYTHAGTDWDATANR